MSARARRNLKLDNALDLDALYRNARSKPSSAWIERAREAQLIREAEAEAEWRRAARAQNPLKQKEDQMF